MEGRQKDRVIFDLIGKSEKSKEYVISFTGTKIDHVTINITFDSDLVQEREKPL